MSSPISCLLCQSLLPPKDLSVFSEHLQSQHRAFSGADLVLEISRLDKDLLGQVEAFVKKLHATEVKHEEQENECKEFESFEEVLQGGFFDWSSLNQAMFQA